MTALRGYIPAGGEAGAVGVHSLDHFTLQVPALAAADDFYSRFGLDVRADGNTLALRTFGQDHRWGAIVEGKAKRLHHISFGCYAEDLEPLKRRAETNGVALLDAPLGFE